MNRRSFALLGAVSFCASTIAVPALAASSARPDRVQVLKSARRLDLISDGKILRSYPVSLGSNPVGPKRFEGDGRTPEGGYLIAARNPRSQFFRSLLIDYPRAPDLRAARQLRRRPGGDIFIHGEPNRSKREMRGDWTAGCVAVTNEDMAEIWNLVPVGVPIHIFA